MRYLKYVNGVPTLRSSCGRCSPPLSPEDEAKLLAELVAADRKAARKDKAPRVVEPATQKRSWLARIITWWEKL